MKKLIFLLLIIILGCSSKEIKKEIPQKQEKKASFEKSILISVSYKPKNKLESKEERIFSKTYNTGTKRLIKEKPKVRPKIKSRKCSPILTVSFSPDGKYIAAGSADGNIRIWEAKTGKLLRTLYPKHNREVRSVHFSPDARYLVSGGLDGSIRIWETRTGKLVKNIPTQYEIDSVCFSPDGKYIASGSRDKKIRIWDAKTGKQIGEPLLDSEWIRSVCFSPDGRYLVSGNADGSVKIWSVKDKRLIIELKEHKDWVESVAFSPDERLLATGSADGVIKIWNTKKFRPVKTLRQRCWINSISFSPDGRYLVSGSNDKSIRIWDVKTGKILRVLKGHKDSVTSVLFSPNGRYIISGSRDGSIRIWNIRSRRWIVSLWAFSDDTALAVSSKGEFCGKGNYYRYLLFVDKTGKKYSPKDLALYYEKSDLNHILTKVTETLPPFLQIRNIEVIDQDKDNIFTAGEYMDIFFEIVNEGKGSAYDLLAKVSCFNKEEKIFISKLSPNKKIRKHVQFRVPKDIKDGKERFKIELYAGKYSPEPKVIQFETKAAIPPKFDISWYIDDDLSGESQGNNNGRIEPGETIEFHMQLILEEGTLRKVRLTLESPDVTIIKGEKEVELLPGKISYAKFLFFVPWIRKKKIDLKLNIKDEAFGVFDNIPQIITLDLKKSEGKLYVIPPYGKPYRRAYASCVRPNPNHYLFAALIYDYDHIADLRYIRNDLSLIKRLAKCYMAVPDENINILKNPSCAELRIELKRFIKQIKRPDSILFFYYSGHGIVDSKGCFYLLPSDAYIKDERSLKQSSISIKEVIGILSKAKGKKSAFIDACRIRPLWKPYFRFPKGYNLKDMVIIFSTKQGELSNIDKLGKNSAFTRALYEMACNGLKNLDMNNNGYVEVKELIIPLKNRLKEVSAGPQTPEINGDEDIPVFPVE